jgi:hypothetical protein
MLIEQQNYFLFRANEITIEVKRVVNCVACIIIFHKSDGCFVLSETSDVFNLFIHFLRFVADSIVFFSMSGRGQMF